ncbi:MAG: PqqD family protein [Anaerolineae bacterium]
MLHTKRPRQVSGYQVADKESLNGEMVLFHPATQKILYSNRAGALIWGLCDGQRTVADIIQLLSEAYPDSASEIGADVRDALLTFVEQGAIEWV